MTSTAVHLWKCLPIRWDPAVIVSLRTRGPLAQSTCSAPSPPCWAPEAPCDLRAPPGASWSASRSCVERSTKRLGMCARAPSTASASKEAAGPTAGASSSCLLTAFPTQQSRGASSQCCPLASPLLARLGKARKQVLRRIKKGCGRVSSTFAFSRGARCFGRSRGRPRPRAPLRLSTLPKGPAHEGHWAPPAAQPPGPSLDRNLSCAPPQ